MRTLMIAVILLSLLVTACSTTGSGAGSGADGKGEAWRTATLTDVVTGASFTIASLEGKVVALESMAIWCSTCRIQQGEARLALAQLGSADVIYISLDVDPRERAADLADYARREGFDWRFVVGSPELLRSLADTFGDQVLSPPATPLVVLAPDGRIVEQHIGVMASEKLAALLAEHLP